MDRKKLLENISVLSSFEKISYLLFIRLFQSKEDRIFFEGCLFLPGQMYKAERKALYDAIRDQKPDYCFEIGTYTGGGSTFFISKALKDNNKGKLFTIENYQPLYQKAVKRYKKFIKENYPFIDFILSSTPEVFTKYLNEENKSHMIFLDGAEDGQQTLEQYNFFKPYFKKGTILALHDWNTEKTVKVKPVILSDSHWKKVVELGKPVSVGFVVFEYA
jgi:predicted O-methyltransferase YrrM